MDSVWDEMTLPAGFRLGLPEGFEWLRGTSGDTGWWLIVDDEFGDEHFQHRGAVTVEALASVRDPGMVVRMMVERAVGSGTR